MAAIATAARRDRAPAAAAHWPELIDTTDAHRLARRAAVFGLCAAFLSSAGQTFFIGWFGPSFREAFALGDDTFGALYGLATLASGFAMFWLGALADRRHPRQAISISLAVVAGGAMCLALAPAAGWLLVGIFLLRLGGQGLTGHIAIVTAARHGGARRGRIIAIAVLGFILAEATLPFVITTLPALQHWRWTWGTVAGIVLVVALPAMRRIAAPLPDRAAAADAPTTTEATMTRASLFANPVFLAALLVLLASPFIVTAIFLHQGAIAAARGWAPSQVAAGFFAFALSQGAATWLAGRWVDHFGSFSLMRIYLLPMALGLLGLATLEAEAALWILFCGLGVSAGANGVVAGSVWVEAFGTRQLGLVRGVYAALMVLSTAISPVLLGLGLAVGQQIAGMSTGAALYTMIAPPLAVAWIRRKRLAARREA